MLDRLLRAARDHASGHTSTPDSSATPLARLLGDGDRVVVVDVETTGVYTSDRVVEIALVTLGPDGTVLHEWETLVNPCRDVGPTWLHGISASMVSDAPTFADVAALLAERVEGAVVAAHNLPFDLRMLAAEFQRANARIDFGRGLDTFRIARCRLGDACAQHGISLVGAHRALHDARATGHLLVRLAEQFDVTTLATRVAAVAASSGRVVRRDDTGVVTAETVAAPYLARLAGGLLHADQAAESLAYLDVLDRVMADLHIDDDEARQLTQMAHDFGLDATQMQAAHRRYLDEMIDAASADGVVTADEYDELCRAAAALGVDQDVVDRRTVDHRSETATVQLASGMRVCFTGAAVHPVTGAELTRSVLKGHATSIGLVPTSSVTQKNCDLLVAADTSSRSGKAGKARSYGIPIVSVADFFTAGAVLPAVKVAVTRLETLTCESCGKAWTRPPSRGKRPTNCDGCAATATAAPVAARVETLRCGACGTDWTREVTPGRKATTCPDCEPQRTPAVVETETLHCEACDQNFTRERTRGRKPKRCADCR